jgi:catechol 2,3-dioxygenase-like lactoylglutathione lyase family enzyme
MIDHIAHPSYDAAATHRFYSDVLGAHLKAAFSGESAEWNARYLLAAYELEGAEIDLFTFEGITRPQPDALPRDIRHVGLTVPAEPDLARVRGRLDDRGVEHWIETRDDGEHLYVTDPNGLVIEFSAAVPPYTARPNAFDVLQAWIEGAHRRS